MAFDRMAFVKKFSVEAREHLEKISNGLMELEKNPENQEILQEIFRSAHTLKGSARMLKLLDINQIAHKMEDLLGLVKENRLQLDADITDLLLENCDAIDACLDAAIDQKDTPVDVDDLVKRLESAMRKEPFESKKAEPSLKTEKAPPIPEKPLVSSPQSTKEEMQKTEIASTDEEKRKHPLLKESEQKAKSDHLSDMSREHQQDQVADDQKTHVKDRKTVLDDTIRLPVSRLDNIIKLISEILLNRSKADQRLKEMNFIYDSVKILAEAFKTINKEAFADVFDQDNFETISGNVLELSKTATELFQNMRVDFHQSHSTLAQVKDEILNLRMVPIGTLFSTFPRSVRMLAKEFNKKIDIVIEGVNTELDKKIIEELNDPLVHLIRNAIDHGIEEPADRIASGKPEKGTIRLSARQGRGTIIIEIEDDGRGIDIEKIKESALRKQLVSREELSEMTRDRLLEFLFMPGFSTSRIITDISGRGVGLDVVKKNVEDKLKGAVSIDSRPNQGSKFTIFLPLTLTTMQTLLVRVGDRTFAIPYSYVQETHFRSPKDIIKVVDKTAINIRDQILPLVFLGKVLRIPEYSDYVDEEVTTIILRSGQDRMVFIVDEIIDEQEVVVKPLGSFMQKLPNLSGITILGDGEIVIILHVPDLIYSARVLSESVPSHLRKMKRKREKQRILVVDDSLNTREVEKNILEAHDYDVDTAIDGQEAFEIAVQKDFDLVVTDIEMPRVNGFELTKRLRSHEKYKNIPIIIVTSRDKEEDRKKGIEIGADAYIIKSAFDEGNLIDTIDTLIGPPS